jgi:anaerobic glycerol-3-phosphate dehydrogenase
LPDEAKVVFFLNADKIDPTQRQALHREMAGAGRTAVWFYAPGYVNGEQANVANIEQLTGIAVDPLPGPRSVLFCGVRLHPELFRALAIDAGAHIYGDSNDSCTLPMAKGETRILLTTKP